MTEKSRTVLNWYLAGHSYSEMLPMFLEEFGYHTTPKNLSEMIRNLRKQGHLDGVPRRSPGQGRKSVSVPVEKTRGLSVTQLREKYDVKYQVGIAVKKLQKDVFLTKAEFIQLAGIKSGVGFNATIELPEFEIYRGKASGTEYWSHPESILQMKNEGVLR